jgi:hypothetical protein
MKSLLPYLLVFALIIGIAIYMGQSDPITPMVLEARAETAAGPVAMSAMNQGASWLLKLLTGATVAGVLGFALGEGYRLYQMWLREENTRRWRRPVSSAGAPVSRTRLPKISREEMLMLMLGANKGQLNNSSLRAEEVKRDDLKIDL